MEGSEENVATSAGPKQNNTHANGTMHAAHIATITSAASLASLGLPAPIHCPTSVAHASRNPSHTTHRRQIILPARRRDPSYGDVHEREHHPGARERRPDPYHAPYVFRARPRHRDRQSVHALQRRRVRRRADALRRREAHRGADDAQLRERPPPQHQRRVQRQREDRAQRGDAQRRARAAEPAPRGVQHGAREHPEGAEERREEVRFAPRGAPRAADVEVDPEPGGVQRRRERREARERGVREQRAPQTLRDDSTHGMRIARAHERAHARLQPGADDVGDEQQHPQRERVVTQRAEVRRAELPGPVRVREVERGAQESHRHHRRADRDRRGGRRHAKQRREGRRRRDVDVTGRRIRRRRRRRRRVVVVAADVVVAAVGFAE
eukprot:31141-Pelagococcus_subviridis.AAC.9